MGAGGAGVAGWALVAARATVARFTSRAGVPLRARGTARSVVAVVAGRAAGTAWALVASGTPVTWFARLAAGSAFGGGDLGGLAEPDQLGPERVDVVGEQRTFPVGVVEPCPLRGDLAHDEPTERAEREHQEHEPCASHHAPPWTR